MLRMLKNSLGKGNPVFTSRSLIAVRSERPAIQRTESANLMEIVLIRAIPDRSLAIGLSRSQIHINCPPPSKLARFQRGRIRMWVPEEGVHDRIINGPFSWYQISNKDQKTPQIHSRQN